MHRVHASARGIESGPKALPRVREHRAPIVPAVDAAVRIGARAAQLPVLADGHVAARRGVDCELISRLVVDALYDVDLAVGRPLRAREPEGGPGAAGCRWDVREL